jgi:hypothetical protein
MGLSDGIKFLLANSMYSSRIVICLYSSLSIQIVNSFSQQFFVVVESAKSKIAVVADVAPKLIREVTVI